MEWFILRSLTTIEKNLKNWPFFKAWSRWHNLVKHQILLGFIYPNHHYSFYFLNFCKLLQLLYFFLLPIWITLSCLSHLLSETPFISSFLLNAPSLLIVFLLASSGLTWNKWINKMTKTVNSVENEVIQKFVKLKEAWA